MMQEQIGFPACFSSGEKLTDDPSPGITRLGQNVYLSVYRTKIADLCRSITVGWCKNLLLHGLSVSVEGPEGEGQHTCKVELKPWCFWKRQGSKRLAIDGKSIGVFWDLRTARFNGQVEPCSDYYVAVVCDDEVVLLLGNLRKEAYRKTGCRPALIDPILIARKEHVFGKKKFVTRARFHDKGGLHELCIECKSSSSSSSSSNNGGDKADLEMEIRIDGHLVIHVKHLQWKFRGNELVHLKKTRVEVYWDVHDWLFSPGLRHALFIFKPLSSVSTPSSPLLSQTRSSGGSTDGSWGGGSPEFSLFLYAWRVE